MDLSELKPAASQAPAMVPGDLNATACGMAWDLASQIGVEVAAPLTAALDRVCALQASGRIDRPGLHALRDELQQARRASIVGQQIARLAQGGIRQQHEALNLAQMLRDVLAQREQDLATRGLAVKQLLNPSEVVVDAALLSALIHALFDWSLKHARTPVEIRLDKKSWPPHARVVCRFGHMPPDQVATVGHSARDRAAGSHLEALDCLSWRLMEHIAVTMQLTLERADTAGDTALTIEFPSTVGDHLQRASPIEVDNGSAPSSGGRPLPGRNVLVIAISRDVRNQVRQAVSQLGLSLDFVTSVEDACEFCRQGLPQAIIYESSAHDRSFEQLRSEIRRQANSVAWIEITDHGEAFEVSSFGGTSMARVGRDAITTSLPSALMFELARGV